MKYFLVLFALLLLSACESDNDEDSLERKAYRFPSASSVEENAEIITLEKTGFSDATYYPDGTVTAVETQQELQNLYHNLFDSMVDPDPVPPEIDFKNDIVIAALGRNHHTTSEITITAVTSLPGGGITVQVEAFYGDFGVAAMTKAVHIVSVKKRASQQ